MMPKKMKIYERKRKEQTFLITSRQKIDEKYFHWLKSTRTEKYLKCRFQKEEIFTI